MKTATGSAGVPNVLVVEDEMVLRMRAVDIVEDAGFNPVEAVNADEALAILESARTSRCCLRIFRCRAAWMV
jgi:CheY-like chemotaxis protein